MKATGVGSPSRATNSSKACRSATWEATLADALGDQAAISKSTVSSVCQAIKDEYQAWAGRRLDGIVLEYLFLDASFFRMHPGSPAEPVLAAQGITTEGKPAFVGLGPAPASPPTPGARNILAKIPARMQAAVKDAAPHTQARTA